MQLRKIYVPFQHFFFSAVIIVALTLLVACGTNGGATTTTTGSGSNTTITGSGGTTQAPTPTKTLAAQNCGTVHTMRLLVVPADANLAKGVENCFWQAFQQCHPATLVYAQNNLDTGTIHNFSLKNVNGTCVITDGLQNFIAPRPPQSTTNYTCAGLTQQADGLHFHACGTVGDILVPLSGGTL